MNKRQLLNGLTILGILCCIELAIVYYQSNYNPYAEPSFCNMNSFVDCDGVAQTSKAVFLGIPGKAQDRRKPYVFMGRRHGLQFLGDLCLI